MMRENTIAQLHIGIPGHPGIQVGAGFIYPGYSSATSALCTFYAPCLSRSSSASLGLLRVPQHNTCCFCPALPGPSHSPLKYLSISLLVYPPDSTVRVISWPTWMYPYQETFRQWKYFWFLDRFNLYHNTFTFYAQLIVLILLEKYVLVRETIILSKVYHLNIWHKIYFSPHLSTIGRIQILLELKP